MTATATSDNTFIKSLLMFIRAHDQSSAWDSMPDEEVLAPYILSKEQRREIPLFGDPDPDILWRVEQYFNAIAMAIETRSGRAVAPIMKIHHEGWGRMILTAGKLVAVNSYMRELHRFGFDSIEEMSAKAQKLIDEGVATIEKYPDVAAA
ncbi:MAG: NifX-associated nitrogen fixation protein [Magnetospirillum sp.]|nr:NifX-associated nitrogen fixation protein [Magnetospirillum sp.]